MRHRLTSNYYMADTVVYFDAYGCLWQTRDDNNLPRFVGRVDRCIEIGEVW